MPLKHRSAVDKSQQHHKFPLSTFGKAGNKPGMLCVRQECHPQCYSVPYQNFTSYSGDPVLGSIEPHWKKKLSDPKRENMDLYIWVAKVQFLGSSDQDPGSLTVCRRNVGRSKGQELTKIFYLPFPIRYTYFCVSPPQMALLGFFHVDFLFASPKSRTNRHCESKNELTKLM